MACNHFLDSNFMNNGDVNAAQSMYKKGSTVIAVFFKHLFVGVPLLKKRNLDKPNQIVPIMYKETSSKDKEF
ncbi:hypothetical protein AQUCO_01600109v1 [Aquilegia coerulea]|uniref:Uncharacterized protein n=1 Tax=Aquilegia coerulea TaxID=218851 RepID=A0A2G5DQ48_AQUCA|nr:hypothetical protein AQUCO_01600109v1 [Aquilegia coerulea]